jgi:hypothetical protein
MALAWNTGQLISSASTPRCLQRSRHRNAATPQNMDWLREAVAEYLSGFSNQTGSPHAARSGFLPQLCRGRRRIGIHGSAACGRTGRVMLGKFDAADRLVVPDVDTAR